MSWCTVPTFRNETEFNATVRAIMAGASMQCVHVREADCPGVLDLIVWRGRALVSWIELKLDDEEVRTSQREFMLHNPDCCMVLRWKNVEQRMYQYFSLADIDLNRPYVLSWTQFIEGWVARVARWGEVKQKNRVGDIK